jgi:hypothetical protein
MEGEGEEPSKGIEVARVEQSHEMGGGRRGWRPFLCAGGPHILVHLDYYTLWQ